MPTGRAILLAVVISTVAACNVPGLFGPAGGVYPDSCESLGFEARQCAAIVARAEADAGIEPAGVTSIDILAPATDRSVRLGGQMIARVRFHGLAIEPDLVQEVWCVGIIGGGDRACNKDANIGIAGGVDHDVPCTGEAPGGCATLPPTPRPASIAKAASLRLPTLDIPIAHMGRYEIAVGTAGLPDGVLTERSARLADPSPDSFWIADGIIIEVRPVDPTRPPVGSIYRNPFDGVEPVRVFLKFDVTETTPGAVLQVRDIVVR